MYYSHYVDQFSNWGAAPGGRRCGHSAGRVRVPDSVDVYGAVMLVGRKELTSSRRWDSSFADASRMMHSPSLPCQIPRNSVASPG